MLVYPREYARKKDTAFASVARAAGGGRALPAIGLSFRDHPETAARVAEALARAKKQPTGLALTAKRALIRAQYNWSRTHFTARPGDVAMCWNGLTGSRWAFMQGARDAGARRLYLELAPFPGRITLDPEGVNAEGSVPQDRAFYDAWSAGNPDRSGEGWRGLGQGLVARGSRRADVGQGAAGDLTQPFVFVPLQVPDDSQMRLFAGWAGGLEGFIAALGRTAAALPEGWVLRVKEHPSAKQSMAGPLAAAQAAAPGRIVIDNATDSFALVAAAAAVLTINSSMGLQAFFRDRPVIATGRAFWNQPGLTSPADSEPALAAALAAAPTLGFDPLFRARFLNWLDRVYYPRIEVAPDGAWALDPAEVRARLAS
ncbi:capsular biosynthesis protein [Frigidibacter sp. MR17.14]|uniref:capsular polysaccharide export protein, LipB/KpsS family n=1 Tax=Frigidibacter sp. MR17.14 TaxID=3126509 RepID=UPI003013051D